MLTTRPITPPASSSPPAGAYSSPWQHAASARPAKRRKKESDEQLIGSLTPPPAAAAASSSQTRLSVKGTVTPSRAAPFFTLRPSQAAAQGGGAATTTRASSSSSTPTRRHGHAAPAPSPRTALQLTSTPTPRRLHAAFHAPIRLGDARTAQLQALMRRPPPAAAPWLGAGNPALITLALRSGTDPCHLGSSLYGAQGAAGGRGLFARPQYATNTRSYLATMSTRDDVDWYELESSLYAPEEGGASTQDHLAHPLCCAYAYSAKAAEPNAQWLAVGDNEGRIVLINTLDDSTAEQFTGAPQWRVSASFSSPSSTSTAPTTAATSSPLASVFELAWRHDDVLLASSAPDYTVAVWDVASHLCTELFAGPRGTARSIAWDPVGAGHLLCSGGRDGAIHLFDRRVRPHEGRGVAAFGDGNGDDSRWEGTSDTPKPVQPVLSIWGAHSSASGSARRTTAGPTRTRGGGRAAHSSAAQRGVTALAYLPGRSHCLVSSGCEDGRLRLWDWRALGAVHDVSAPTMTGKHAQPVGELDLGSHALEEDANRDGQLGAEKRRSRRRVLGESDRANVDGETRGTNSRSGIRQGGRGRGASAGKTAADGATSSRARAIAPVGESADLSRRGDRNTRSHGISSLAIGSSTIFAACTDGNIYTLAAASLLAPQAHSQGHGLPATSAILRQARIPSAALHHPAQRGNTLYAKMALDPAERVLAIGCNSGRVVLYDVRSGARGGGGGGGGIEESSGVVLQGGHQPNSEINGVAWAHGPQGPTLATIADDYTIRTWRPDRAFASAHAHDDDEDEDTGLPSSMPPPLELGSDDEFEWERAERRVWRRGELDDDDGRDGYPDDGAYHDGGASARRGRDAMDLDEEDDYDDSDMDDDGLRARLRPGAMALSGSRFAFDDDW